MSVATLPDYSLLGQLELVGHALAANVAAAATSATLERSIEEASTLKVTIPDHQRVLQRSGVLDDRLWVVVDGLHYDLVVVAKGTDVLTLTFEDSMVAALRRRTGTRKWPAGTTTRAQIVRDIAAEVPVPVEVDPALARTVQGEVNRSKEGQERTDSWSLLGSLASDVGARRFSTGRAVVVGFDEWLTTRYPALELREPVRRADGGPQVPNPVLNIDFTIDYGQASSSATLLVDADRWAVPPGQGVTLAGMGPADGRWLVVRAPRVLTRDRMTVELSRLTPALAEPPAQTTDAGEFDFLPGATSLTAAAPGPAAGGRGPVSIRVAERGGSTREQIIAYARAQNDKPYIWGGNGPKGFDCSGLVQEATRAAGKVLVKTAANQWNTLRAAGKTISVQQALDTPGALLFRIGKGEVNHVAISLGGGRTVEARGRAYGCGEFDGAAKRTWTGGGLWP